jgi:uncharacterized protein (UPF0248 family)
VRASDARELGRSFFEAAAAPRRSGSIPHHRVRRIVRGSEVLWERPGR